jgi:hypothetical protein
MNNNISAIRACEYLFLHSVSEPPEGGVQIVVHEAKTGAGTSSGVLAAEPLPELRKILAQSSSIVHSAACKVFTITWPKYIGYSMENESYALPEPTTSKKEGRLFVEYSESVYLQYIARSSFASTDYPGPFKHWAVYCLDHVFNVASTEQPLVQITNDA